mmetsp:Transcript_10383/g.21634  ORF Transcript_10383/g.21634 Transcript_10383/m.21634 type:complete len:234 (-) Transcript_10383:514-1215(-)|eukprot:CAMPEP_0118925024 /NCGR_PEP_ID=MMETSP1169-20130426/2962_1 /TAXON_ID=36882 /ORGANISM="Pyramimonas obovata, Strain CCMP722" /LENGTH=233 /DNA_ID=CAMNT_0006866213 /DNA_START=84 /DNA_END=785 /DNA_ORIENTATION=-
MAFMLRADVGFARQSLVATRSQRNGKSRVKFPVLKVSSGDQGEDADAAARAAAIEERRAAIQAAASAGKRSPSQAAVLAKTKAVLQAVSTGKAKPKAGATKAKVAEPLPPPAPGSVTEAMQTIQIAVPHKTSSRRGNTNFAPRRRQSVAAVLATTDISKVANPNKSDRAGELRNSTLYVDEDWDVPAPPPPKRAPKKAPAPAEGKTEAPPAQPEADHHQGRAENRDGSITFKF